MSFFIRQAVHTSSCPCLCRRSRSALLTPKVTPHHPHPSPSIFCDSKSAICFIFFSVLKNAPACAQSLPKSALHATFCGPLFFRGPVPRPKRWLAAAAASRASKEAPQRGPERSSRSHFPQGRPRTLSERSAPSHHPGESAFLPCSNGARTTARCGLHDDAPAVSL